MRKKKPTWLLSGGSWVTAAGGTAGHILQERGVVDLFWCGSTTVKPCGHLKLETTMTHVTA